MSSLTVARQRGICTRFPILLKRGGRANQFQKHEECNCWGRESQTEIFGKYETSKGGHGSTRIRTDNSFFVEKRDVADRSGIADEKTQETEKREKGLSALIRGRF
jgi:hypothetical protein